MFLVLWLEWTLLNNDYGPTVERFPGSWLSMAFSYSWPCHSPPKGGVAVPATAPTIVPTTAFFTFLTFTITTIKSTVPDPVVDNASRPVIS